MRAFHNDPELKEQILTNLREHLRLDHYKQGLSWNSETQKGCGVGCTLVDFGGDPYCHKDYERLFGIPVVLARIKDNLFESLSCEDSKLWPINFISSINVGADLSLVWPKFSVWLLIDNEHGVIQYADTPWREVIQAVASLQNDIIGGGLVSQDYWEAAARDCIYAGPLDRFEVDTAAYIADGYGSKYATGACNASFEVHNYPLGCPRRDGESYRKQQASQLIKILTETKE